MKILVVGFQRSGTTLLKDLIWKHPGVQHMFHETALMRFQRNDLFNRSHLPDKRIRNNYQGTQSYSHEVTFDRARANWGEKMPYWVPRFAKGFNASVGKYCSIWNQYFGNEARILNIIRHPLDVAISTRNRGWARAVNMPLRQYKKTMPIVLKQFDNFNITNIMHVQFENLVTAPRPTLKEIYKFCGLKNGNNAINKVVRNKNIFRFKKIEPKRAFSHVNEGKRPTDYQLKSIIELLNSVEGIQY